MLTKKIYSVVVIGLLLVGGLFAQPGPGPMQGQFGNMPMLRGLDLTAEQLNSVLDIRLDMQKKMIAMQGDLQKLQKDFRLMVIDEKVSDKQLEKQLQKIHDLKLKMALERAKHHRQIRSLLTDAQKKKFDTMFLMGHKGKKGCRPMMQPGMKMGPKGFPPRP
ncbi:Spy/CpxP family protein refolding chaperone [Caldithrix abyssi]|uniref:LTXXQ motif family protein n=1 Tax=Caldithrix abyssi DSM 13497 TaxID=880073 RepID=H1XST5_CALAY|nr:Spy/CpxP family protein refolding chaperone [Caldithrix abyssi]APF20261.1 LTXXQ motif family protein [Caldithrix abyssi DSM 13497]EHO40312.1 hypothetical protein Calab_0672 [Caldithrix abyssi DSM 13497]